MAGTTIDAELDAWVAAAQGRSEVRYIHVHASPVR